MKIRKPQLSYANVMATIALFIALGGTSYAAFSLPKNSVGSKQLKKNAVVTKKIKNRAVTTAKLANRSVTNAKLANNAVTAVKVKNGTLLAEDFAAGQLPGIKGDKGDRGDTGATGSTGTNGSNATVACPSGTVESASICFENSLRGAATALVASQTCLTAGGYLADASVLYAVKQAGKVGNSADEEWSGTWTFDTVNKYFLTVNQTGIASAFTSANNQPYRCAFNKG